MADLEFHRLANARDLGGLQTAAGPIAPGRLIRAAALHRAKPRDQERLRALGLRTALDLRTDVERREHGILLAGIAERELHLPLIPQEWEVAALAPDVDGSAHLAGAYADMLVTGADAIRTAFTVLGDPAAYPVVLFCAAGKDRTGTLVALVLAAAGVDEDAIVADYARSDERLASARAQLPAERREAMAALHPALLASPPAAMRGLLATLRERHGGVGGFLATLGIGAEHVEALRRALIAQDPVRIARRAPGDHVS